MSSTNYTSNLHLPQYESSDIPTWADISAAFAVIDVLAGAIAPVFSTSSPYAKGAIVQHEGGLFKAKNAVTAGTWNASDWDSLIVSENLESSDLTNFVKYDSAAGPGLTAAQYAKLKINA